MLRICPVLLAWLLLGSTPWLGAWTDSYAAIRAASSQVSSVQADFEQTKRLPILKRPIVSRGRFIYRRPGQIRWEYQSPVKMVVLLDERGVRRFTFRDGKWVPDATAKLQAVQSVLREMKLWMAGDFEKSNVFAPQLLSAPPRVRLTPKEATLKKYISSVELWLGAAPGAVDAIEIREGPKASTRIEFSGVSLNGQVPDSAFEPPR